jgi:glycosyltransferase involved in cell wall biosynthesis
MLVEFIIPTYHRPAPLASMIASLVAQTDGQWEANVVIDGTDHLDEILEIINRFNDSRIKHTVTDKRYNDWGHTPRELGKQMSTAEYIIMTGDDNYYTPNFVAEIRPLCEKNVGMVYWDMVHSHYDYAYFKCAPVTGQIDMGAFATRRDLAQQIKLSLRYDADGLFVENFKEKFPKQNISKIDKILFVHN